MKKHIKPCNCETCKKARYWTACAGCKDGHPSFWKTICESPQWKLWYEEQNRRESEHNKKKSKIYTGCFDINESQDLGVISSAHFQEFISFCKLLK